MRTLLKMGVVLLVAVLFILPREVWASNQIVRPLYDVAAINTIYDNATTDTVASLGLTVNMTRYDASGHGRDLNNPAALLKVMTTANTREGIQYNCTPDMYSWHDITTDPLYTLPSSDNTVFGPVNLNCTDLMNCPVRYYGGPGDCEYTAIWISTNGWISFFDPMQPAPPPGAITNIPYQAAPNALVLLYSGYLYPSKGGAIRYGQVMQPSYYANLPINCFCVSWDGVPDQHGNPQSFQVLIEQIPYNLRVYPRQTQIWFQYKQITVNSYFEVGLEDQQGCKAATYSSTNLNNQLTLLFDQETTQVAAYVSYVNVTISTCGDSNANTYVDHNEDHTRGYNLQMNTSLPPEDPLYTFAGTMAEDGIGLLSTVWDIAVPAAYAIPGAGIVLGCATIGYDLWRFASEQLAAAQLYQTDWKTYGCATATSAGLFGHVEARLGMVVGWVFNDINPAYNHTLTITATLGYRGVDCLNDITGYYTLRASVTITVFWPDNHNLFSTAWVMTSGMYSNIGYIDEEDTTDYYEVMVPKGYKLDATMYPPTSPNPPAAFTISIYNQNKNLVASTTSNSVGGVGYVSSTQGGYCWISVSYANAGCGYYSLDIEVYQYSVHGGCPFVCPWNGTSYVTDNNLLSGSEQSSGADVGDYYMLEQPLVPTYAGRYLSTYSLRISESENEHSYLDKVRLTAVDADKDTNVAVTPTGEILTYKHLHPPIMALDQDWKDWFEALSTINSNCYQSKSGDYLTLYFGQLKTSNAKLVLREDLMKDSIHVQLLTRDGSWMEISDSPGRINWTTDTLDLSPYLQKMNNPVEVRLYFTAVHRVDYIGLDTTPQANIQTNQAQLLSAVHSVYGNVWPQIILDDNHYAQLTPGQYITLMFLLPTRNPTKARTFIIFVDGHYLTIQQ